MNNNASYKAQELLYNWMSNFEKRSYSQIKEACNFLNMSLNLKLGEHPVAHLLFPLVYTGVIDHVGQDYYALSQPVMIDFGSHIYSINSMTGHGPGENVPVGWALLIKEQVPEQVTMLKLNSLSVLKSFPRIDYVIETWNSSLQDTTELVYHDFKHQIGVAEYRSEGRTQFFSIPDKSVLKEIPPREKNPDAYRIAICYERSLTGYSNGVYYKKKKLLRVQSFAFPFVLYRALMLDGLAVQVFPKEENGSFLFENITPTVVKELNRILCKSIRYE